MDESKMPILVGCGQVTQREPDPKAALSPMDLTAAAVRKASSAHVPAAPDQVAIRAARSSPRMITSRPLR